MSYETIKNIQAGVYIVATFLLVVFLYSYIFYLYRAQRSGAVDYEKYAYLALDDSLDDAPIEKRESDGYNKHMDARKEVK